MRKYKIVWSGKAILSLTGIRKFIQKNSPKAAQKVAIEILNLADSLQILPDRFSH